MRVQSALSGCLHIITQPSSSSILSLRPPLDCTYLKRQRIVFDSMSHLAWAILRRLFYICKKHNIDKGIEELRNK